MKEYFTSDLHFLHTNIVKHTNRGVFTSQDTHDRDVIDLWNKQVNKNDIVYHLGDFVFNCRRIEKFKAIKDQLNGQKILIRGNHCDRDVYKKSGFEWYDLKMFTIREKQIVMCHYPLAVWQNNHRGSWCLHGHSHGNYTPEFGKILDVGLDSAYNILGEHRFFTFEDVQQYMQERKFKSEDHHVD